MNKDITLIYGLGAAKSGTTWLYEFLKSHPDCYFRSVKELNYFDAFDGGDSAPDRRKLALSHVKKINSLGRRLEFWRYRGLRTKSQDMKDLSSLFSTAVASSDKYLDYLTAGIENQKFVGDLSVNYSALSEEMLSKMASVHANSKFIYIMRDPLDRMWSYARMFALRYHVKGADMLARANDQFDEMLSDTTSNNRVVVDYRQTLERVSRILPTDDVFIGFFDLLVKGGAVEKLERFLGLSPRPNYTLSPVHVGQSLKLDPERRVKALEILRPQYDFVSDFVAGDLPDRWQQNMSGV